MQFSKMHGAGNDYVYVDCFSQPVPSDPHTLARQVSDRHFGIGGDGLVLTLPSTLADAEMRMFNADGSEAEMCGNALRCVVWFLREHGTCQSDTPTIHTGRGSHKTEIIERTSRGGRVRIDMGKPILEPNDVPTTLDPCMTARLLHVGNDYEVSCVSMGNPHCVLFVDSTADAPVTTLGPQLEHHEAFPKKANIGFSQIINRSEMKLRVWERGTGETLACGTGACAAVVAAILTDRCDTNVTVHLPGGDLQIEWPNENSSVFKTGPVREVFTGTWNELP